MRLKGIVWEKVCHKSRRDVTSSPSSENCTFWLDGGGHRMLFTSNQRENNHSSKIWRTKQKKIPNSYKSISHHSKQTPAKCIAHFWNFWNVPFILCYGLFMCLRHEEAIRRLTVEPFLFDLASLLPPLHNCFTVLHHSVCSGLQRGSLSRASQLVIQQAGWTEEPSTEPCSMGIDTHTHSIFGHVTAFTSSSLPSRATVVTVVSQWKTDVGPTDCHMSTVNSKNIPQQPLIDGKKASG